jgi:hypothetical protein
MPRLVALCPLLALVLAAPTAGAPRKPVSKSLTAGDWTLAWTGDSGKATGPGGRTLVLWEPPKKEKGCDEGVNGDVLSVVGTIVSFDLSAGGYCEGAAHPYAVRHYVVKDLARNGKEVSLYDFFDKAEVQRALDADPFLRKEKDDEDAPCRFTLEGFEKSFAFHHVEGDKVAVRVGLTHGCEVMRGNLTQLGLLLTPKPDLLARLEAAEKSGTLMKTLAAGKK